MMPIVNGLEEEFSGRVAVVQLDAALKGNAALQSQWGLRGHPTFALLDSNGEVVQTLFGSYPESNLRRAMESVLVK
jgi:hypothetical protein